MDEARATLEEALRADPGNSRALVALARLEVSRGASRQALRHLDQALAKTADPAGIHALKGSVLHQAGMLDEAAAEYETALRHQERTPLALNNLAMLYADRKESSARGLELALRAYALEPGNPAVLDTLGYALLKNGRAKDALPVLERAAALGPGNAEIEKRLELARQSASAE